MIEKTPYSSKESKEKDSEFNEEKLLAIFKFSPKEKDQIEGLFKSKDFKQIFYQYLLLVIRFRKKEISVKPIDEIFEKLTRLGMAEDLLIKINRTITDLSVKNPTLFERVFEFLQKLSKANNP